MTTKDPRSADGMRVWRYSDGIVVHTYDAHCVRAWLRGVLETLPRSDNAVAVGIAGFLAMCQANGDKTLATAIYVGRRAQRQGGEQPLQMEVGSDPDDDRSSARADDDDERFRASEDGGDPGQETPSA